MKIVLAEHCGFCYGVKRAVALAKDCIGKNSSVKTLGPIIHNPQLVEELSRQGIAAANDLTEITEGIVIIRSHGVGPEIYDQANKLELEVVDATCPHVHKAQQAARQLLNEGYRVVIVGEKAHPEVKSILQWAEQRAAVVETIEEAQDLEYADRMGVVAQTTFSGGLFEEILGILKGKCQELQVNRTICTATDMRQEAAVALAKQTELMVVIGGKNSANTSRLAELCRQSGCRVKHIETKEELTTADFRGIQTVGITAGASTPEWIIEEVMVKMQELNQDLAQDVKKVENGVILQGKVVEIRKDEVYVDIGYKAEGSIPLSELAYPTPENAGSVVRVGECIEVMVLDADGEEGIKLSKIQADRVVAWDKLQALLESKGQVEGKVSEVVKGGLRVSVLGIAGFVPASQVDLRFVDDLSAFQNQTLTLRPIEIDPSKQRVVLSRKAILQEELRQREAEVYDGLRVGDQVKGTVKRILDFGAFVDIGHGVEGLVHISDLSWRRVKTANEVVQVGDAVSVIILKVDKDNRKLSLGLKQAQEDPWLKASDRYQAGMNVKAKITKILKIGALAAIHDDVEGLIHISELSDKNVAKVEEVVAIGQEVTVKILEVNKELKRISLSMAQAQADAEHAEYSAFLSANQSTFGHSIGDKLGALLKKKN
jgi:4-hydroxy-3-methylbut-2-enyl diphosphate reductase